MMTYQRCRSAVLRELQAMRGVVVQLVARRERDDVGVAVAAAARAHAHAHRVLALLALRAARAVARQPLHHHARAQPERGAPLRNTNILIT